MPCRPFSHGGMTGFVCGPAPRTPKCKCGSGRAACLLCDWKMGEGKTCDAKLCSRCTTQPATDKDLCPAHAKAWSEMQKARAR